MAAAKGAVQGVAATVEAAQSKGLSQLSDAAVAAQSKGLSQLSDAAVTAQSKGLSYLTAAAKGLHKTHRGGAHDELSLESQVMGATILALIVGGSLKGLIDSTMSQ
jgi:hypothetical protein